MWPLARKTRKFFSEEENEQIVQSIRDAEKSTSGEIRVFVESKCRFVDALDRAAEIFMKLDMQKTQHRNAVLVYVALKDRQLALFGDEGIHQKLGNKYWHDAVKKMIAHFNKENYAAGISQCVKEVGEALHFHFPYDKSTDKNELPDEIVFGK
ncbi:MAG TPA: TPM domain-containing protein [Chitinophagaceae bacterium]|nr:TPM domain-containing protein [Chitinophagaceae bacterium]